MKFRAVVWVVGLLWSVALVPLACTGPAPSEMLSETPADKATTEAIKIDKGQETLPGDTPPESVSDAGQPEPVDAGSEPRPEQTRTEQTRPETTPEEVIIQEPITPDDLIKEMIREVLPDSMFPKPGFGQVSGQCDVLDQEEWTSSKSYLFRNTIDFGAMDFDETKLTPGGQKIWKDGNLGGSSVHSEIFAYELLHRCEAATLLKSEGEILYKDKGGKKTDLLVTIDTRKIGVSVTRAFHFPPTNPYTEQEATTLLTKKLKDIPLSTNNADPKDAWTRSILYILAYNKQYADTVGSAYQKLDSSTKSNVLLMITVTDGKDDYIY